MKKTILAGIAGAAIAGAIGFAAPAVADTAACAYFPKPSQVDEATGGICGIPDLATTAAQSIANLHDNLDLGQAGQNLQSNFNAGAAAGNLQHALTHGVGSQDQNAP
jgi:hypothetical protein